MAKRRAKPDETLGYPVVMIEWTDSSRLAQSGWLDMSELPDPYFLRCVSVGLLISENKEGKLLVPTISHVDHADYRSTYGGMMIPASAVVRKWRLR